MKKSTKYTAVLVAALFAAIPVLGSNTAHAATTESDENVATTQSSADNQTGSKENNSNETQKSEDKTTSESENDNQKYTADAKVDSKGKVANQDNSQNNKGNVNKDNNKNTSKRGETAANPIVLTGSYDSSLPLKKAVEDEASLNYGYTPYVMNVKYRENLTVGSVARFIGSKTHIYADGSEVKTNEFGTSSQNTSVYDNGKEHLERHSIRNEFEQKDFDDILLKTNDFYTTWIMKDRGFEPSTWYKLNANFDVELNLPKDEEGNTPEEIKNRIASIKESSDHKDGYDDEVITKTDNEGRMISVSDGKTKYHKYHTVFSIRYTTPEITIYVVDPNTPGAVDIPTEFDQVKTNTSDNNSSNNTDDKTTPDDNNNSSTPDNTDSQTSQSTNDTDTTPSVADNTTTQNTTSTSDVKGNSNNQSTQSTDDKEVTRDTDDTATQELTLVHNAYIYDKNGKVVKNNGKIAKLTKESKFSALNNGKTVTINGKKFYQIGDNQYIKVANAAENPKQLMFTHNAYVYKKNGKLAKDKHGSYILLKKYTNLLALNNGKITTIKGKRFYQIGKNQYVKVANTGARPKAKAVKVTGKLKSSLTKIRLYNSNGKFTKKYAKKSKNSIKFDQEKTIKGKKYYRIAGTNNWIRASKVSLKK